MTQTHIRPSLSNLFIFFFFFAITSFSLKSFCFGLQKASTPLKGKNSAYYCKLPRLSLSLHPHSSIGKPPYKNYSDLVISRRAADKPGANFINSKLHNALPNFNCSDLQPEDLETSQIGSNPMGEYLAWIGVGQPVKEFYLIADTGSHINWLQCLPRNRCFEHTDPIFRDLFDNTP